MYKRDAGILLLSAFAVYFTVQNEGPFYFRKAWYHNLQHRYDEFALPVPLVADLNGDGKMEVIVATQDSRVRILGPKPAGHVGEGFADADIIADVTLMPPGWPEAMISAKRAVAMKNGFLDARPVETVRARRKQVLVVVLADWTVICFDHNLQRLWYTTVKGTPDGPYGWAGLHTRIREVGILITNHTVKPEDRGLVVVGGRVDLGDLKGDDPLEAELQAEKESTEAGGTGSHSKPVISDKLNLEGVDISRHFSYHALDGGSGAERWSYQGEDFHRDTATLAEVVIPQHNYRLEAASLESSNRYGGSTCRDFRESVLNIMPHRWTRRADTELRLAHFSRHREGQGERKGELAGLKQHSRKRPAHPPTKHGVDHTNPVARALAQAADKAARSAPANAPRQEHHVAAANVVLAHLEEGIEAVDLYTGQSVCKLHLPAGGLHTDLNADGMLDHIQVVGETHLGEARSSRAHDHSRGCTATALSGLPPNIHFFNGTVCAPKKGFGSIFRDMRDGEPTGPLQVAPPAVLPAPAKFGLYRHGAGYAAFLNSLGEMTLYDNHGEMVWQHTYDLSWETWEMGDGVSKRHVEPTLKAIPLRWGGIPTVILASGAYSAAIISEHGHVLDKFRLPASTSLPLQVGDFNGDGLTDVMMVGHESIFGWAQLRRPGGVPFSALLALLMVSMVWVYITHQAGPSVSKKGRSTDRVD